MHKSNIHNPERDRIMKKVKTHTPKSEDIKKKSPKITIPDCHLIFVKINKRIHRWQKCWRKFATPLLDAGDYR